MNTNQFLQTARTVTFIIQKNKSSIPAFDIWYSKAVENWKTDVVMTWAKDSRNVIEKQGDLDSSSVLEAVLMYSYFEERDVRLTLDHTALVAAGIKKLIRAAQKQLPSGAADTAIVRVERRWVCKSLPHWELLHAFSYIYARIFECCLDLASKLDETIDRSIPHPRAVEIAGEGARQVRYVKLNGLQSHAVVNETCVLNKDQSSVPEQFRQLWSSFREKKTESQTLDTTVSHYAELAQATFTHFGNHVPMLFFFDQAWMPIDHISTVFADQADKFVFWRTVASRAANLRVAGAIWISEAWIRRPDRYGTTPIRNLPITDERLSLVAVNRRGVMKTVDWRIVRETNLGKPSLLRLDAEEFKDAAGFNYLAPLLRAIGAPVPVAA